MRRFLLALLIWIILLIPFSPGFAQWQTDVVGNPVAFALYSHSVSDGLGGAYVTYVENWDAGGMLRIQRFDKYGYANFQDTRILTDVNDDAVRNKRNPFSDNAGGVYVVFNKVLGSNTVVQHIDSIGARLWGDEGKLFFPDSVSYTITSACSDGTDGAYFFCKVQTVDDSYDIVMFHLDSNGEFIGSENGIKLDYNSVSGLSDIKGQAGTYILYYEVNDSLYNNIKVNIIGPSDEILWGTGISLGQYGITGISEVVADSTGLVLASINNNRIIAQRISPDGTILWGDDGIAVAEADTVHKVEIASDNHGEYIFIWNSGSGNERSVYAQKVGSTGNLIWGTEKKIIEDTDKGQYLAPQNSIIFNNDLNVIICTYVPKKNDQIDVIYAHRIDAHGDVVWRDVRIGSFAHNIGDLNMVSDGNGGGIITYSSFLTPTGTFIKQISKNGNLGEVVVSINDSKPPAVPNIYKLYQSYPNPFNSSVNIRYTIPKTTSVNVTIYNVQGKEVAVLIDNTQLTGEYTINWNGKDKAGIDVASGVYFYRLQCDKFVQTRKAVLIK